MSTDNFRSAINGFNRQDVASYISESAKRAAAVREECNKLATRCSEQEAQITSLSDQLRTAKQQSQALGELLAASESRSVKQEQQINALTATLESARLQETSLLSQFSSLQATLQDQAELEARTEAQQAEIKALQQTLAERQEELRKAQEQVSDYESLRERLLNMELHANRRAVETEREAADRAAALLQDAEEKSALAEQNRKAITRQFRSELFKLSRDTRFSATMLDNQLKQLSDAFGLVAASIDDQLRALPNPDGGDSSAAFAAASSAAMQEIPEVQEVQEDQKVEVVEA